MSLTPAEQVPEGKALRRHQGFYGHEFVAARDGVHGYSYAHRLYATAETALKAQKAYDRRTRR